MNFDNMDLGGIDFLISFFKKQGFSVSNFEVEDDQISFVISNHGKRIRVEFSCDGTSPDSSVEEIESALEYLKMNCEKEIANIAIEQIKEAKEELEKFINSFPALDINALEISGDRLEKASKIIELLKDFCG